MSIFKETADKARQDAQAAQQKLKEAQSASFARATKEKQRLEAELESKFQAARELLLQINAEGLLNSIRTDVWGMGKVDSSHVSFEVGINQKSDQSSTDPFGTTASVREWPNTKLTFFKNELPKRHVDPIYGRGSSITGTHVYWKDDGQIYSEIKITAQYKEKEFGVLITRKNSSDTNSPPKGDTKDFFVKPSRAIHQAVTGILEKIVYEDVRTGRLPQDLVRQAIEAAKSG